MIGKIAIANGSTEFELTVDDRQATFVFSPNKFTVMAKNKQDNSLVVLQFPTRDVFEGVKSEGRLSNYLIVSTME